MQVLHTNHRRHVLGVLSAALIAVAMPLAAQTDYPNRPIKVIIPLPAGGAADVGVRAVGAELEKSLKQAVVVENKAGGLFQIGIQALLAAPADGYTLLHLNAGMVGVQVVQKKYDINRQLLPITVSGETPMVLIVGPKSPYKTLKDLLDFGRSNPGKLNYSTPGPGSIEHLKHAQIEKVAGFAATNVAYKGGPDMVKAVIGGEVQYSIVPAIFAAQFAPKGMVGVLAVIDSARLKDFPDVPTIAEAGVNVSPLRIWGGYAVHPDTPAAIVQRLHKELTAASLAQSVSDKLTPFGMLLNVSKSPEDFRKQIAADVVWMDETAKSLKLEAN